jgi:hypothetical protein
MRAITTAHEQPRKTIVLKQVEARLQLLTSLLHEFTKELVPALAIEVVMTSASSTCMCHAQLLQSSLAKAELREMWTDAEYDKYASIVIRKSKKRSAASTE